jgi:predicted permease
VLGARPLVGRTLQPGQDEPGRSRVVVLSESLWRRRFGADRSLPGRTIRLDGDPYQVIGVMPASFNFPPGARVTDAWTLYVPSPRMANERGSHFLAVTGRLKAGVSLDQASVQLKQVAARIEKAFPAEQTGRGVLVLPLQESEVGRTRKALLVLLGAVALVLLIACANVANLLLARAAVRRREVAVRLALGAGRGRLVRQFLVESMVLALAGALLGLLLAWGSLRLLEPLTRGVLPIPGGVSLDARVFGFLLGVAVLSGLAFGIVPALQSARGDVRETLGDGGGKSTSSRRQQRFRYALVVVEIAVSLVLLTGAGLLLRGFLKLSATEPGFAAGHVLTAHLALPEARMEGSASRLFLPLLQSLRRAPGVSSAALISMLPIQSAWTNGDYAVEGRPAPPPGQEPHAELRVASPGVFQALGIPILQGADFRETDGEKGREVVIVNEALARRQLRGESPLGHRLIFDKQPYAIVGMVGNVRQAGLDHEPLPEIYFPYRTPEIGPLMSDASLVVRTTADPATLANTVRQAARSVDPGLPLYQVMTMDEVIAHSLADRRLNLWLLGLFAGMALVLSAAGLYGVISYLVAQRTREIGVRIALGAQTRDVIRLVMRQGAGLTGVGIAAGLLSALAFTRVLASLLYGVSAHDPLTFAGIAALLAAVALAATWIPARRAARVDPIQAIRSE